LIACDIIGEEKYASEPQFRINVDGGVGSNRNSNTLGHQLDVHQAVHSLLLHENIWHASVLQNSSILHHGPGGIMVYQRYPLRALLVSSVCLQ